MAKSYKDLDVRIGDVTAIRFRRTENDYFFRHPERPVEPVLTGTAKAWIYVGYVLSIGGLIATLAFIGMMGITALFNSSAMVETTATITGTQGQKVFYTYTVDGVQYEKEEDTRFISSAWNSGNAPEPARYLSFMPSVSRLTDNIEKLDVPLLIFAPLMLLGWTIGGFVVVRDYRRMTRLRDEATHLLDGVITGQMNMRNGPLTVYYAAVSPTTGQLVKGSCSIGKLESVRHFLTAGTKVAVLYRDDKLHMIL